MMRGGEMSSEPETLDHRQAVQKGLAHQWEGPIDSVEEQQLTARHESHDVDAPDDFFEDDTGNEGSEVNEPANMRFSELPAKQRPERAENRPDKHSKRAGKDSKKSKHMKSRKVASPATIQDSFFGDESE
jgi:hypothetical protein